MERQTGTIKWFNRKKGFGFIQKSIEDKIFVHMRDVKMKNANLKEGQLVEFTLTIGPKGPKAEDVIILIEQKNTEA